MKKIIYCYLALIGFFYACKEEGRIDIIDQSAPAPQTVELVDISSIPGGAVIRYRLPHDENLLGVKAVYTRNGQPSETKASLYVDTLRVEGFGDTAPKDVLLYSIGKNEKLSEPLKVTVEPLAPPVQTVKFDVEAGFGGVIVSIEENRSNADLAVVLMADTLGNGEFYDMQTFYTKSEKIKFPRRGLKPQSARFGVYLRDRWNNVSDTVYRTVVPIEEVRIPSDLFRNAALPTDFYTPAENHSGYRMENLWIGADASGGDFYASSHNAPMPAWFTIDLGRKAKISRIQKWPRSGNELYSSTAPRVFQVWGSDNPNLDGSWDDSWFLIGEFEQFKPSGYGEGREVGPITDEDSDYWYNRTEFEVMPTLAAPDPYRPVTHLRFTILSNYNTYGTDAQMGQVIIAQLAFWRQLVK